MKLRNSLLPTKISLTRVHLTSSTNNYAHGREEFRIYTIYYDNMISKFISGDNLFTPITNSDLILSRTFEAQLSPEILYSIVGVFSVLIVTVYVWWTIVIPQQRSKLAISKRKGDVKQFLDNIEDDTTGCKKYFIHIFCFPFYDMYYINY